MNTMQVTLDNLNTFSTIASTTVNDDREKANIARSGSELAAGPTQALSHDDACLIQALKSGDEATFSRMVELYHNGLLRLARTFLASQAIAEEVVQDTWVCVLEGLHRFEGRSSFKTWVYRILMNRVKTRAVREAKYVPLVSQGLDHGEEHYEAVEPGAFHQAGILADSWMAAPTSWDDFSPERLLLSKESFERIQDAMETLPSLQKQVLILRDVEGLDSKDVCQLLHLSETNQRVLLHRARGRVRRALDAYIKG